MYEFAESGLEERGLAGLVGYSRGARWRGDGRSSDWTFLGRPRRRADGALSSLTGGRETGGRPDDGAPGAKFGTADAAGDAAGAANAEDAADEEDEVSFTACDADRSTRAGALGCGSSTSSSDGTLAAGRARRADDRSGAAGALASMISASKSDMVMGSGQCVAGDDNANSVHKREHTEGRDENSQRCQCTRTPSTQSHNAGLGKDEVCVE